MNNHFSRYPPFDKKLCELLALLILKFDAFARGFSKEAVPQEEILHMHDLLDWIKKPEVKPKTRSLWRL